LYGWLGSPSAPPGIPNIYKTTNGGINWLSSIYMGDEVNSIYFIDRNKGWAACHNSIILATTNSGLNWTHQSIYQFGTNYHSIYFADSLTGWVVGDSGRILKTTTGGILTNFTNSNSEIPDRYSLSQNYPNPFNPLTHLEFGISNLGFVSLKVFDVLGNEVATLVNEKKNPGSYEVEFDGSNLSSGIYFYRLEVDENIIDTKRMVLLK
jgi:Secretion system C-terminal sorting domain